MALKPMNPLEAMRKAILKNPAYQIIQQTKYNEALAEAQQILAYGFVQLSFKEQYVYDVCSDHFLVRVGKTKVYCNCGFYRAYGFCSHVIAVQEKRKNQNKS